MSAHDDDHELRLRELERNGAVFEERWTRVEKFLSKIDRGVNGDADSPGLKGRVDRLEQKQKTLARWGGALLAVLSAAAALFGLRH